MKEIRIKCPATVANIVCGFDILGLALQEPYDIMKLKLLNDPRIIIHNEDDFNLPTEPELNVAGVVLSALMEKTGNEFGFELLLPGLLLCQHSGALCPFFLQILQN